MEESCYKMEQLPNARIFQLLVFVYLFAAAHMLNDIVIYLKKKTHVFEFITFLANPIQWTLVKCSSLGSILKEESKDLLMDCKRWGNVMMNQWKGLLNRRITDRNLNQPSHWTQIEKLEVYNNVCWKVSENSQDNGELIIWPTSRKRKKYRSARLALGTSWTLGIFVDLEEMDERLSSILTASWGGERREWGQKIKPFLTYKVW